MGMVTRCIGVLLIGLAPVAGVDAAQSADIAGDQSAPTPEQAPDELQAIVSDYLALRRATTPNDALPTRSPEAVAALHESQDRLLTRLHAIDPSTLSGPWATAYATVLEHMESLEAVQVCRMELWDINHITGWQVTLPPQAATQPVKTAAERERALRRWSSLPAFIDTDVANLRMGMRMGYVVPKTVVRRVLGQIDRLIEAGAAESPFAAPARNTDDAQFQIDWRLLVSKQIDPTIKRFRDFLRIDYLPRARDSIGLAALPDGERCYAALLRRATTLDRSPRATFDLGQATVQRSRIDLQALGRSLFGCDDIAQILRLAKAAPANRFKSSGELLAYSEAMLDRSTRMSAAYFLNVPGQAIEIAPMPGYQRNSGIASHYEAADSATQPAFFRIDLDHWSVETRGAAAVTVVHETIPGHHLQTVMARTVSLPADAAEFSFDAAYVEGWANYVERLCEEAGIYDNPYAAIFRRSVLGESLLIDPAVHIMGWSRERVRKYLEQVGQTRQEADETIDRIAVQPAQFTSYETGGLEIFALREEARAALGPQFDVREFHQRVLEQGDIPLSTLREHVREWIRSKPRALGPIELHRQAFVPDDPH